MNFLMSFADFFAKGGPLMWPILLCSVLALAIVLFKTLEYTTALHTLGKIKQGDSIPLPWFLAPICERLGTADEETLSLTANRQVRKLERGLGVLELITTIAPILGLTGTVTGMISTFQAIGEHGSRVDPSVLCRGYMGSPDHDGCRITGRPSRACRLSFLENRLSELIQTVQEIVDVRRIAFCGISHEN